MSDIKQLLEKANRKCEMRWRVFAFDPAKDNELVHTSKDAFDCIKMAGEYKMDLAKKHPDYIIEVIAESKEQKNEADKVFLKKIEDVLHRYNLPSAKIVDERKVDNTHYIYKIDVNSTDYAKAFQRDVVDFDKLKKDNALKALSFLEIDGIYPQRNSQSILMQINFRKGKPESSQKNEAYSEQYKDAWNNLKVGDTVQVTDKDYQFTRNMKVTRIYSNGTNKIVEFDFSLPSGKKYTKPLARIYKDSNGYKAESAHKNESTRVESYTIQNINSLKEATIKVKEICKPANLDIAEKLGLFYDGTINIAQYLPNAKQLVIFKESAQKNESLNLDSLTDEDAKQLIVHLQDFIKDKSSKYYHIDKIETILKKKYKAESAQKNETKDYKIGDIVKADFNWRGVHAKPVEGKIVEKRKAIAGKGDPQPGFEYLIKSKDGNSYWVHQYGILESSQKNEEKEFTIKLVTPFGKAKVCSWKANSVDAAVKEFLDANPAYRENKKGAVIAESSQKNETFKVGDKVSYKVSLTGNSYKGIVKQIKKDIYGDELIQITEPDGRTSWRDARDLVKESLGDDIVREVKEEVKDGVKDLVQQDVDAKLNGEVTPADYQATYGEDIDDDSDSIFGDELDNVEPEQIKD